MLALYRSGRQAEALEVYRRSRERLVDELGIEPDPELRSLAGRILRQEPSLDWTAAPVSAPDVITPTGTFVGRKREIVDLRRGLDDIHRGHGSLFLISGEAGIGKTALTEHFVAGIAERDARVLSGRCWESGGAPAYWPWVQCLRVLVRESEPGMLAAQLGAGAADIAEIIPELQDIHAADDASLLLLRFVSRTLTDARLQIIATTRSSDRAATQSFASTLAELARVQRFHQIRLDGLSREEVGKLVAASSDVAATEQLVDRIYSRTDGHPFFVSEMAQLLATDSDLDLLPQGVRAAVSQRLALLPEECRELLAVASVVGREFNIDILATAIGVEPSDVVDHLEEALTISIVFALPTVPGRYRFGHELIREVLYDGLTAPRAIALHRQVGEALELTYAAELDPHAAELAHHFALAAPSATVGQAVRYASKAAERAGPTGLRKCAF
jgi:predicted ATPase